MAKSDAAVALAFCDPSPDVEDLLQDAMLQSLQQKPEASILVLDRDIQSLSRIVRDLDALGHQVVLASMPLDAVRWVADLQMRIEVVVVDRSLAYDDGLETLKFIAQEFPSIRRILISDALDAAKLGRWVEKPAVDAVLRKP